MDYGFYGFYIHKSLVWICNGYGCAQQLAYGSRMDLKS